MDRRAFSACVLARRPGFSRVSRWTPGSAAVSGGRAAAQSAPAGGLTWATLAGAGGDDKLRNELVTGTLCGLRGWQSLLGSLRVAFHHPALLAVRTEEGIKHGSLFISSMVSLSTSAVILPLKRMLWLLDD